jgi:hypothetical protein
MFVWLVACCWHDILRVFNLHAGSGVRCCYSSSVGGSSVYVHMKLMF